MKPGTIVIVALSVLVVALLGATGVLMFTNIQAQQTIRELRQTSLENAAVVSGGESPGEGLSDLERALEQQQAIQRAEKKVRVFKIRCKLCDGGGQLLFKEGKREEEEYPCPVCRGRGHGLAKVPTGRELCSKCRGMGLLPKPVDEFNYVRYYANNCVPCQGTGQVKAE